MQLIKRFQKRLLNSTKIIDYLFVFIIGGAPIFLSIILGIWEPKIINGKVIDEGYKVYSNFHSHTFILPLSLFLLRFIGDKLFGVNVKTNDEKREKRVPILTLFKDNVIKDKIHKKLKEVPLHPSIFFFTLFCDLIFHSFEGTLLFHDIEKIISPKKSKIEEKDIPLAYVYIFSHLGQFIIFFIAVTAIILLLFHNIFYLTLIYQRSAHKENIEDHIVLDFDDPNHRFGLESIAEIFNIQLFVLFFAGVFSLYSRFAASNTIDLEMLFRKIIAEKDLGDFFKTLRTDLYPTWQQPIIVLLWLFTFFVVLLPLLVKFLPFFSPQGISNGIFKGWSLTSYLQEFIADDERYPLKNEEQLNIVASKFAWNAFWPTGDDPARWTFIFVFFIFFLVLFPLQLTERDKIFYYLCIIAFMAVVLAEIFLNIYTWFLGYVDKRLVKKTNIKPGDTTNNYNLNHARFGGGFAGTGGTTSGGTYNDYSSNPSLADTAAQIQQLLQQFEATNPTETETIIAAKAADKIKSNPILKAQVIDALKSGGKEAFKEAVDNPVVNILVAIIEGWIEGR